MEKKISFDKNIYKIDTIRLAMEEYKEIAGLDINEEGEKIEVEFTNIPKEYEEVITDEFANYVLSLSLE